MAGARTARLLAVARSRRRFILESGQSLALLGALPAWAAATPLQTAPAAGRDWPLDANGDGRIDAADLRLVEAALSQRRGRQLQAATGWDFRADVLAQGGIREAHLRSVTEALGRQLAPRPLVTCWHYGWYRRRRNQPTTVRYFGGNYASSNRATEEQFNRLKEEFGISADLLSWAADTDALRAYASGYLAARNRARRRVGLLYEAAISMRTEGRIDFAPPAPFAGRLVRDFRRMGTWLRGAGEPLLRVDSRPVIYVFGSHTFGTVHANLPHVGQALIEARAAFAGSFGTAPYLIGDESLFPGDDAPGVDRLYRARFFDASARYHHYDEQQVRAIGSGRPLPLDPAYRRRLIALERRTQSGFAETVNQFTGAPLTVIPCSAAGFAKRGMPTLHATEAQYAGLLRDMQQLIDEHASARPRTAAPPLVLVGSWNEEYEGHALMPAARSQALGHPERNGFDWLYAIKSVYGWNHWANRDPEAT